MSRTRQLIAGGGLGLALWAAPAATAEEIRIVVNPKAPAAERTAAGELAAGLQRLYPHTAFPLADDVPASGRCVWLGDSQSEPRLNRWVNTNQLRVAESFVVTVATNGPQEFAVIVGANPLGTAFGVAGLLEKLGFRFQLSGAVVPPPGREDFSFAGWLLADAPVVGQRILMRQPQLRGDVTDWSRAEWEQWIAHAQKLRFNTVLLLPPATESPPANDTAGSDWGTARVNDARRLCGSAVFDQPRDRDAATLDRVQRLVSEAAAARGLHFALVLNVDTPTSKARALLPDLSGRTVLRKRQARLVLPVSWDNYLYYQTEVEALLDRAPHLDRLVLWIDCTSPWLAVQAEELPPPWQAEFRALAARDLALAKSPTLAGRIALGKVAAAVRRALHELERDDVLLLVSSSGPGWMSDSAPCFPPRVPFLAFDDPQPPAVAALESAEWRAAVRWLPGQHPITPVLWAQPTNGACCGRSFTPPDSFASKLADAGNAAFGIVPGAARASDLFVKNLAQQVWSATLDQSWRAMVAGTPVAEYWQNWLTAGPMFGTTTGFFFHDQPLPAAAANQTIAGCRARLALLDRMDPAARPQWEYLRGQEEFCAGFYQAEAVRQTVVAQWHRDPTGPNAALRAAVAQCRPETIIDDYARRCAAAGRQPDDRANVIALNLNWRAHFVNLRQALALEPVRVSYGPPLAAPDRVVFHADTDQQLWRRRDYTVPGASAFALPAATTLRAPAGLRPAERELGHTGIECAYPIPLRLQPVLHDLGAPTPGTLRPGLYQLRLLLVDPSASAAGQRVFNVVTGPEFTRYNFRGVNARFLRLVCHEVSTAFSNAISEVVLPTLDRAAGTNTVTASAALPGHPPTHAVDGTLATSWLIPGEGAWIQFALQPDRPTAQLDIAWPIPVFNQVKFDLLLSADGRTWDKIQYKPEGPEHPGVRVDIFKQTGGANRILEIVCPVVVGRSGVAEITLVPEIGKALVCAAILEPVNATAKE